MGAIGRITSAIKRLAGWHPPHDCEGKADSWKLLPEHRHDWARERTRRAHRDNH